MRVDDCIGLAALPRDFATRTLPVLVFTAFRLSFFDPQLICPQANKVFLTQTTAHTAPSLFVGQERHGQTQVP